MAWAALVADALPKWICYWQMACGGLLVVSFGAFVVPAVGVAGAGGPLYTAGMTMLGIILLRRSRVGETLPAPDSGRTV
jgi:hypothetical protein